MTSDELHDVIISDPEAMSLADVGDDAGCAARLSAVLPPVIVSFPLNERGIFAIFPDPSEAEAVMQGLEAAAQSNPVVKRALRWLSADSTGIDLGHPAVRAMLDQLAAAGAITAAAAARLKAVAERPVAITADQVSEAWARHRPDGRIAS